MSEFYFAQDDAFDTLNLILDCDDFTETINRSDLIAALRKTFKAADYWCEGLERDEDHVFSNVPASKIDLSRFYLTLIAFVLTGLDDVGHIK